MKASLNKLKTRDPLSKRTVSYLTDEGFNFAILKKGTNKSARGKKC